jgi:hypothetical protein
MQKLKYFTMQKTIIFKKSFTKKNKNPSRYYNSIITNLQFQHKPKKIIFQKSLYKNKIDLLLHTEGSKSLQLLYTL